MPEHTSLFVYGTLCPGASNHGLIASQVHSARPASTRGILVDLGGIPAMIPGDGLVMGVLLEVDKAALKLTDRLEGVPTFYRRVEATVRLEDESTTTAWTYRYADPVRIADCRTLLLRHDNGVAIYAWSP